MENHMSISKEYQKQLIEYAAEYPSWGNGRHKHAVVKLAKEHGAQSVLDYGCGTGATVVQCNDDGLDGVGYDPRSRAGVNPGPYAKLYAGPYDMVTTQDVLEHIEPDYLDDTLIEIRDRATMVQWHRIACLPARAILPDGRNAHLIVKPPEWWAEALARVMPEWEQQQWGSETDFYSVIMIPK
jgi:hypothetical protein